MPPLENPSRSRAAPGVRGRGPGSRPRRAGSSADPQAPQAPQTRRPGGSEAARRPVGKVLDEEAPPAEEEPCPARRRLLCVWTPSAVPHLRDCRRRPSALSPHTRRKAARFEAERGLPSRQLEGAIRRWRAFARRPGKPLYLPSPHLPGHDIWDDRLLIERAIGALDRRAAREVASLVKDPDSAFLTRTLPNPRAPRSWPWWRRRCQELGEVMLVPSQQRDRPTGS